MKTRIKTGAVIALVTCLAVFSKLLPLNIGTYIFDVFVMGIVLVAGYEMTNILNAMGKKTEPICVFVYAVINYLLTAILVNFVSIATLVLIQLVVLIVAYFAFYLIETIKNKGENDNLQIAKNTILACIYPVFFFCLMLIINHADIYAGVKNFSFIFITFIFVVTMLTDTCAYFVGSKFKGPKLAPAISPNKTISGAIGGLLGGILGAGLLFGIAKLIPALNSSLQMYGINVVLFMGLGLFASLFGQIGDLFESKLKRIAGVKDSGNIFPGHGGMMDRVDAMTFVTIFVFICIVMIVG